MRLSAFEAVPIPLLWSREVVLNNGGLKKSALTAVFLIINV